MKILCIGLTVCDIAIKPVTPEVLKQDSTPSEFIRLSVGGDAFNVATNLLTLGIDTTLISAIGTDPFGVFSLGYAKETGISVENIQIVETPTSVTAILIHPEGERNYVVQRGASHYLQQQQVSDEAICEHDIVYVGSACDIPGLDSGGLQVLFARAQARGKVTALDVTGNPDRKQGEALLPVLRHVDIFLPSIYEVESLYGIDHPARAAAFFHELGIATVVIKMGHNGVYVSNGKESLQLPACANKVVDTTGAGDALVSGFLAAYSKQMSLEECAKVGNAAGGVCVGKVGSSRTLQSFAGLLEKAGLQTTVNS